MYMNTFQQDGSAAPPPFMAQADTSGGPPEVKKINLTQARKILGVSPNKMSKLIAEGTLSYVLDPLDQRVKLVALGDVERLKRDSAKS
jgi:hypothetical protein